jgi:hypothetical protein
MGSNLQMAVEPNFEKITPQDWASVRDLIKEVQRSELCDVFAKTLFWWDLTVKTFRKVEFSMILLGEPTPEDFQNYFASLAALIAIGHSLIGRSREFSPDELAKFEVTHEQIEAYVEDLQITYREHNHGFTSQELGAASVKIFGETAGNR